jgi:sorbitol-specific phosphotransferase system component IIBC
MICVIVSVAQDDMLMMYQLSLREARDDLYECGVPDVLLGRAVTNLAFMLYLKHSSYYLVHWN